MVKPEFVEPMLLLYKDRLPSGPEWLYEIKLDGYRALAIKSGGKVQLRSRNNNDFNSRYPAIADALRSLPDETMIDGEVVAIDDNGRPAFNLLQNYASAATPLIYYVFDALIVSGRDLRRESLEVRRRTLEEEVLPCLDEPVRYSQELRADVDTLVEAVKAQGLEGLIAKRRSSRYESGRRSGAWLKTRVHRGQEFVIGGYTIGAVPFDALIFGYYEDGRLIYAARTRNGFTPGVRDSLMKRFRSLEVPDCPFANLPESRSGRWGAGLTAAKMADCRWLKPILVGQFEFLEWAGDNHLRHTKFVALREDKSAHLITREDPLS